MCTKQINVGFCSSNFSCVGYQGLIWDCESNIDVSKEVSNILYLLVIHHTQCIYLFQEAFFNNIVLDLFLYLQNDSDQENRHLPHQNSSVFRPGNRRGSQSNFHQENQQGPPRNGQANRSDSQPNFHQENQWGPPQTSPRFQAQNRLSPQQTAPNFRQQQEKTSYAEAVRMGKGKAFWGQQNQQRKPWSEEGTVCAHMYTPEITYFLLHLSQ